MRFVHDGGEAAPAYAVTVSDGSLTDGPSAASVSFSNVNDAPALVNNALTIAEGGTVVLDGSELSATDVDTAAGTLRFTVSGVSGGQFELVASPGTPITSFTQQQVSDGDVQFVHDGGEAAPAYAVTVSDGSLTDGPSAASVSFGDVNDAPALVNNALTIAEGGTVVLDGAALSATDVDTATGTLAFSVTSVSGGRFELVASPESAITSFTQQQVSDGDVRFVHDGGETAPAYSVTVGDDSLSDGPSTASISFTSVNDAPMFTSAPVTLATEDTAYGYAITTDDVDAGDIRVISASALPAWLTLIDNGDGMASLSGTPSDAEVGEHGVVLEVDDGTATATQSFTVRVIDTDELPMAVSDTLLAREDTVRVIDPVRELLINDTDPDGEPLWLVSVDQPRHGTLVQRSDGLLEYRPEPNFNGVDGFDYRLEDRAGQQSVGSVRVEVVAVNDPPGLAPGRPDGPGETPGRIDAAVAVSALPVAENALGVGQVAAIDVDGSAVRFALAGADAALFEIGESDGALRPREPLDFEAPLDADGDNRYELEIVIRDEEGAESRVPLSLVVGDVNEPPVLDTNVFRLEEGFSGALGRLGASDPDSGGDLRFTLLDGGEAGLDGRLALRADGELIVSGLPAGVYEIAVRVTDGDGLFADGLLRVRVDAAAGAPPLLAAARPVGIATANVPSTAIDGALPIEQAESLDSDSGTDGERYSYGETVASEPARETVSPWSRTPAVGPGGSIDLTMPTAPPVRAAVPSTVGIVPGAEPGELPGSAEWARLLELLLGGEDEGSLRVSVSGIDLERFATALPPELFSALEQLGIEIDRSEELEKAREVVTRTSAVAVGMTLTVGSVIWLLRSGTLVAAALLISPLWRPLDLVPILAAGARPTEDEEDEEKGYDEGGGRGGGRV